MQYNADILLNLKYNQQSLDRVAATVGRIQGIAKQIKPINLFAPGSGAGADQIGAAMAEIVRRAKAIASEKGGIQQISSTFAGAASTADGFAEVLRNVKIEARKGTVELNRQTEEVRTLAVAYALAADKAGVLEGRFRSLIQQARQQRGLAIGPVSELGTVEADSAAAASRIQTQLQAQQAKNLQTDLLYQRLKLQVLNDQSAALLKQDSIVARLAKKAASFGGAGKFGENLALGVGFPLLFGGGAGSVLGSALGSFVGKGFGGQILGGAIGAQLDAAVKKAVDLGNAVRDIDLERLQELGISITNNIKNQVNMYKRLNDEVSAQAVLATQVTIQTGVFASAQEEIARAGNTLTGTFQNFTATLSNAVALIALPLTNALSGVLAIVSSILRLFNFVVSAVYTAGKNFRDFVIEATLGEEALGNINAWMDLFNGKLDDATGKARELVASLRSDVLMQAVDLDLARKLTPGVTAGQQISNVEARLDADLEKARLSKLKEERNLAAQVAGAAKETRDAAFAELNTRYAGTKELLKQRAANEINTILTREAAKAQRDAAQLEEKTARQIKRTEQLKVQVDSANKLLNIDKQIAVATADGLDVKVRELEVDKALVKTENAIAEIRAKKLPAAQEVYEILLAQIRGEQELLAIDTQRAEELRKINEQFKDSIKDLEYQFEYETATTREKREQLELEQALQKAGGKKLSPEQTAQLQQAFNRLQEQQRPLQEFINKATFELNDLQALAVRVSNGIGNAIANSMAQGIAGLIEGTQTAKEVFANFLKSVGDVLIQEGTKMIGMYIAIGIAKIFAGLSSGGSGGGETNRQFMDRTANLDLVGNSYTSVPNLAPTVTPTFATGGFVTGPTRAIVGEGGEPEYIIPASRMVGAMQRYSAGARGSNVIPNSSASGGGMSAGGHNTYTLETVVINNVEYATVEQVREFSALAARQGAENGYNRSMSTLRNSRSQRSRIGLR